MDHGQGLKRIRHKTPAGRRGWLVMPQCMLDQALFAGTWNILWIDSVGGARAAVKAVDLSRYVVYIQGAACGCYWLQLNIAAVDSSIDVVEGNGDQTVCRGMDILNILGVGGAFAAAPVVGSDIHAAGAGLVDLGNGGATLTGGQDAFRYLCLDYIVLIGRQGNRRQDTDDRDHDHEFDQCETGLGLFHVYLLINTTFT